jgi:stress response protein SCP2
MKRGFKSKLETGGVDDRQPIQVWTSVAGNSQYDLSCFALNESERVPDDRYVVFYGQTSSPNGEITLNTDGSNGTMFEVNLAALPAQIYKLSFTVTIDGQGSMRDIRTCAVRLTQNGQTAFTFDITGSDFQNQKAVITIEIYNKNGWRVAAVANGFNFPGGLDELMAHYGVDVSDDSEPARTSSPRPPPDQQKEKPPDINDSLGARGHPKPQPLADNGPASGKNAEGFDRADTDWV